MAEEKKYVGNGKEKVFDNGSSLVNIGLKYSDLANFVNEKGWINLTVGKKRETDQYGNTHAVWVNEYTPPPKSEAPKDEDPF